MLSAGSFGCGQAVLRPDEAQLLIEGRPAQLGGRAFEVLCALAHKAGQLVTKRELMDRVWP
jgi:DNA-binding winged helix-turn-helix (wHTH) protein